MGNLVKAVETEDRLEMLIALRRKLAERIDTCDCSRDIPPLARRFDQIIAEIDEIETERANVRTDNPIKQAQRKYGK